MTRVRTTIGGAVLALGLAGCLGTLCAVPAQAGCMRSIINRSGATALVSRDGGPWVSIPPRRSQSIRLEHPGKIDVALVCGRPALAGPAPEATVYRAAFTYFAKIDRCYIEIGDGFVEDYFGGGTFGFVDSKPLTLNTPRQGDVVIGPRLEERCPPAFREAIRSRY